MGAGSRVQGVGKGPGGGVSWAVVPSELDSLLMLCWEKGVQMTGTQMARDYRVLGGAAGRAPGAFPRRKPEHEPARAERCQEPAVSPT